MKTFLKISVEKRYHFLFKSQFKAQVVDSADSSSEEKWTENLDKLQRELQELHVTSKEERQLIVGVFPPLSKRDKTRPLTVATNIQNDNHLESTHKY